MYETTSRTNGTSGAIPVEAPSTAVWAMKAETKVMARPTYAHSFTRNGTMGRMITTAAINLAMPNSWRKLYQFLVQDSPKAGLDLEVVNARETIRLAR